MLEEEKLRVLLVDDVPFVRTGIRAFLGQVSDLHVVGEADNGADAINAANELDPDIILMDVEMPVMDGIAASRRLRTKGSRAKIVMLTSHDSEGEILASFAAGADGYVLKEDYIETLEMAIRTVGLGAVWLDPAVAHRVLQCATVHAEESAGRTMAVDPLTKEEIATLERIARGKCKDKNCLIDREFVEKLHRFAPVRST